MNANDAWNRTLSRRRTVENLTTRSRSDFVASTMRSESRAKWLGGNDDFLWHCCDAAPPPALVERGSRVQGWGSLLSQRLARCRLSSDVEIQPPADIQN